MTTSSKGTARRIRGIALRPDRVVITGTLLDIGHADERVITASLGDRYRVRS